jgi:Mg2+ and Co2+ transporter CorA
MITINPQGIHPYFIGAGEEERRSIINGSSEIWARISNTVTQNICSIDDKQKKDLYYNSGKIDGKDEAYQKIEKQFQDYNALISKKNIYESTIKDLESQIIYHKTKLEDEKEIIRKMEKSQQEEISSEVEKWKRKLETMEKESAHYEDRIRKDLGELYEERLKLKLSEERLRIIEEQNKEESTEEKT